MELPDVFSGAYPWRTDVFREQDFDFDLSDRVRMIEISINS